MSLYSILPFLCLFFLSSTGHGGWVPAIDAKALPFTKLPLQDRLHLLNFVATGDKPMGRVQFGVETTTLSPKLHHFSVSVDYDHFDFLLGENPKYFDGSLLAEGYGRRGILARALVESLIYANYQDRDFARAPEHFRAPDLPSLERQFVYIRDTLGSNSLDYESLLGPELVMGALKSYLFTGRVEALRMYHSFLMDSPNLRALFWSTKIGETPENVDLLTPTLYSADSLRTLNILLATIVGTMSGDFDDNVMSYRLAEISGVENEREANEDALIPFIRRLLDNSEFTRAYYHKSPSLTLTELAVEIAPKLTELSQFKWDLIYQNEDDPDLELRSKLIRDLESLAQTIAVSWYFQEMLQGQAEHTTMCDEIFGNQIPF